MQQLSAALHSSAMPPPSLTHAGPKDTGSNRGILRSAVRSWGEVERSEPSCAEEGTTKKMSTTAEEVIPELLTDAILRLAYDVLDDIEDFLENDPWYRKQFIRDAVFRRRLVEAAASSQARLFQMKAIGKVRDEILDSEGLNNIGFPGRDLPPHAMD